jgi:putative oxidoreductase
MFDWWRHSSPNRWAVLPLRLIVGFGFIVQIHYGFSSVNTIGLTPSGPLFGPPGYEINRLYMAALIALALGGVSAMSVDSWLSHRRRDNPRE